MELTQEQQEYLNEQLMRGEAFESLITQEGFKYIKSYYEIRLQGLANGLLLNEKDDISFFEKERQRLIGIKQLLGEINSTIEMVRNERQKPTKPTTE